MNIDKIKIKLEKMLPKSRIDHSVGVAKCAKELAKIYNLNEEDAYLAGILHDVAKYLSNEEVNEYVKKYNIELDELEANNIALSHSVIGSVIVEEEFDVENSEIISAIKYHTTGRENMSMMEKIIYIADLIEEGRDYPSVELLRELTYNKSIDKALLLSFNNTIKLVIDRSQIIHPRTVGARNYILRNK